LGLRERVVGLGLRVQGSGFRVQGLGRKAQLATTTRFEFIVGIIAADLFWGSISTITHLKC